MLPLLGAEQTTSSLVVMIYAEQYIIKQNRRYLLRCRRLAIFQIHFISRFFFHSSNSFLPSSLSKNFCICGRRNLARDSISDCAMSNFSLPSVFVCADLLPAWIPWTVRSMIFKVLNATIQAPSLVRAGSIGFMRFLDL